MTITMSKKIIIVLTLLLAPQTISAAITNSINVSTNTGENSVNSESQTITTGATSTTINVENNASGSTNSVKINSQTNDSESESNIEVQTSGEGTNEVDITLGNQKFELTQANGKTFLKTTDSQGNVTEREWQSREELKLQIDADNNVNIQPAGNEFTIVHNDARVFTNLSVAVDQDTRQVSLQTETGEKTLSILPQEVKSLIEDKLDSITNNINIRFDQQLIYTANGTVDKKVLGLFPVTISKQISVSAESGDIISNSPEKFKDRILNLVSI